MPGDPAWDLMACVNAVWMRLRADARRRWRAWLGVAVLVGLFGGIVTATAAGRTAWRLFAGHLGVIPEVSTPVVLLALVVPGTILLANLISIGPAVSAMRTRPASVLRQE